MSPSSSQDSNYHAGPSSHRQASPTRHQVNGVIVPALLMPPPTTWLGWAKHQGFLFVHALSAPTSPAFRFVLFVFKIAILARACWPTSVNMAVAGGLLVAAAVDLSWTLEMWITGLLFFLHLIFIFVSQRRAELCQLQHEPWDAGWNPSFDVGS